MTNSKKLRLSRQTVRTLSSRVLDEVAGGTILPVQTRYCVSPPHISLPTFDRCLPTNAIVCGSH